MKNAEDDDPPLVLKHGGITAIGRGQYTPPIDGSPGYVWPAWENCPIPYFGVLPKEFFDVEDK